MTEATRPPAPHEAATRGETANRAADSFMPVALLVIGVGITLHLVGAAVFQWLLPLPAAARQGWLGLVPLLVIAMSLVLGYRRRQRSGGDTS